MSEHHHVIVRTRTCFQNVEWSHCPSPLGKIYFKSTTTTVEVRSIRGQPWPSGKGSRGLRIQYLIESTKNDSEKDDSEKNDCEICIMKLILSRSYVGEN